MAKPVPAELTAINMIGEGSELEGVMRSSTDVRVNGTIRGELHSEGKVIIAEHGLVDGLLIASSVDVAGAVVGKMTISERLVLKSTARIEGTVRTARLVVEEGATFDGQCDMGRLEQTRKSLSGNGAPATEGTPEFVFEDAK